MKHSKVKIAGTAISVLMSLLFLQSAMAKLFPEMIYPQMPEQMQKIGLPLTILPVVATLEILCVVVYLIPTTAVLGAVLFTGYLGGAILTHLRVGESVHMQVIFGGLIWLGIYLREPRLRSILPVRKNGPSN